LEGRKKEGGDDGEGRKEREERGWIKKRSEEEWMGKRMSCEGGGRRDTLLSQSELYNNSNINRFLI